MQSSVVLSQGAQDITREWFDFARKRMEDNLNTLEALTRCRTPQDIAAVQSNVVRDNFEDLLQSTKRIADMSVRIADEAVRKMAFAQLDDTISDRQVHAIVAFLRSLTGTYHGVPVAAAPR